MFTDDGTEKRIKQTWEENMKRRVKEKEQVESLEVVKCTYTPPISGSFFR